MSRVVRGSEGSEVRSSDKQVICWCIRNEQDVRALGGAGMKEKKKSGRKRLICFSAVGVSLVQMRPRWISMLNINNTNQNNHTYLEG